VAAEKPETAIIENSELLPFSTNPLNSTLRIPHQLYSSQTGYVPHWNRAQSEIHRRFRPLRSGIIRNIGVTETVFAAGPPFMGKL